MLPKQKRLSGRDITKLFEGGKTTGTPFFVAKYLPADSGVRFSVITPKTVAKSAVLRNSTRRKWYSSIAVALKTATPRPGTYAFVLKKEAIIASPVERGAAIKRFFSR
jgi:RNase P protein component